MGDHAENRGSIGSQISKAVHHSHDLNLHLMAAKHMEEINNCIAAWKCSITEVQVWHRMKSKGGQLKCANFAWKLYWVAKQAQYKDPEEKGSSILTPECRHFVK